MAPAAPVNALSGPAALGSPALRSPVRATAGEPPSADVAAADAPAAAPGPRALLNGAAVAAAAVIAAAAATAKRGHDAHAQQEATALSPQAGGADPCEQELVNWSGTHTVATQQYYQPETLQQLRAVVAEAHATGRKLRPVGSALSPNALAFCTEGMVDLALMDDVLSIDHAARRVTVQAGARVGQLIEALRPHGLTLQNLASIAEQQIGGFIMVGAHGTGAQIPPVDEQVTALKLVTPAAGELDLSIDDEDPALFLLARTSLGLLGVAAEVTLQCVPAHTLVERTFTLSRAEVGADHARRIRENKHVRYMWIPYTDIVVVVTCNPLPSGASDAASLVNDSPPVPMSERLEAARNLLKSLPNLNLSSQQIDELSFTALRDELLAADPVNYGWVKRINEIEADYWRMSAGVRVDASDRILGFDCGGQQWVSEVAFPVYDHAIGSDVDFVEGILSLIEEQKLPAHAPIEQRWTAPSSSPLSPASEKPGVDLPSMYSWVGIIMYLPEVSSSDSKNSGGGLSDSANVTSYRAEITSSFKQYKRACEKNLWHRAGAVEHWAKVELPEDDVELARLRHRVSQKYPVFAFNAIRELFDPKDILGNELTQALFGRSYILKNSAENDADPSGEPRIVPTHAGG